MPPRDLFSDPDGTREAIMHATYRALCEHGYADLTIQRIGDEFPKSKSLVYHHYDGKDELLLDFLSYMLDHFETNVPRGEYDDAASHLRGVLDHVLPDDVDQERREFWSAMIELRAQAAHDPAYREHFARSNEFFRERLAAIVERGVEEGTFRAVDPDATASLLLATIDGATLQRVTSGADDATAAIRDELERFIESQLIADEAVNA